MSLELTEAAWSIEFHDSNGYVGKPSLKLAMLALAFHADDQGNVEGISRERLMKMACMGRSYWGSTIRALEAAQWLDRVGPRTHGGPRKHTTYLLDADKLRRTVGISLRRSA